MKHMRATVIRVLAALAFAAPLVAAGAVTYTLKVPIPTSVGGELVTQISGPADYIQTIYVFGMGFGTLLAIAMVVVGGIRYAVSEVIPSKEAALDQIRQALLGLALLLAAALIVNLINPAIDIKNLKQLEPTLSPS